MRSATAQPLFVTLQASPCSPRKFWKMEVAKTCFPSFWAEMSCFKSRSPTVNWNPPLCVDAQHVTGSAYLNMRNSHESHWPEKRWLCTWIKCSKRVQTKKGLKLYHKYIVYYKGTSLKEQGILNAWEIIVSAWERKIEFVCMSLMLNAWDLRALHLSLRWPSLRLFLHSAVPIWNSLYSSLE